MMIPLSLAGTCHVGRGVFCLLLPRPAALARDDIRRIPTRPVVLRSGRFVLAVALFCLSQKLRQSRDVHAESSSGKPRLDLLEQPVRSDRSEAPLVGLVCGVYRRARA